MISRQQIHDLAQDSYDAPWYDRARRLQQFYSGDYDPELTLDEQTLHGMIYSPGGDFWRDYADSSKEHISSGTHDAAMISSRVMVQGIVYTNPDFIVDIDKPLTKAWNQAFLKKRWWMGRWPGKFLEQGMIGYEPVGISFGQVGLTELGERRFTDFTPINPIDVVWDSVNKHPNDWEWFVIRKRYSKARFFDRWAKTFGHEEAEKIWSRHSRSTARTGGAPTIGATITKGSPDIIYEFEYWTQSDHVIIIGNIESGEMLTFAGDAWTYWENGIADHHANPHGVLPIAVWWDNFPATSKRPVGKGRSVFNIVSQSNKLQNRMNEIVENTAPLTAVSTYQLQDKRFLEFLQTGQQLSAWGKPILTMHPDISQAVVRIPGQEISNTHLAAMQRMDTQISGATGTSDAERGMFMARPGERVSAYEVKMQAQQGGIQRRHMAARFADYLSTLAMIVRAVARKHDNFGDDIIADGVLFEGDIFDAAEFLEVEALVSVSEDAILELGSDAARQKAIEEYTQIHAPFMAQVDPETGMPVLNAKKVYSRVASMYGVADFESLLNQAAPKPPPAPMGVDMPPEMMGMNMPTQEATHNQPGNSNAIEPSSPSSNLP